MTRDVMRLMQVVILLVAGSQVWASDLEALNLYQNAVEAAESKQWDQADRLVNEALAIRRYDGRLTIDKARSYRPTKGSRRLAFQMSVETEHHDYYPNRLKSKIDKNKQALFDRVRFKHKQLTPPKLQLQAEMIDEDGDGFFQPGERVTLNIDVLNKGGKAHEVVVYLKPKSNHLPFSLERYQVGELAAETVYSFNKEFTLPKSFSASSVDIDIRMDELDGFSGNPLRVSTNVSKFDSPELAIIKNSNSVAKVQIGKVSTFEFQLENKNNWSVRDYPLEVMVKGGGFSVVNKSWHSPIKIIRPGEKINLQLRLKTSPMTKPDQLGQLKLVTPESKRDTVNNALAQVELRSVDTAVYGQVSAGAAYPVTMSKVGKIIEDGYLPSFATNRNKKPNSYALIIGNSDYKNVPTLPVPFAVNDAAAMKQLFTRTMGIAEHNIIYLENSSLGDIQGQLGLNGGQGLFHKMVGADPVVDQVYVYYSGHGVPAKNKQWNAYLMMTDSVVDNIESTGYPLDTLYQQLSLLNAKNIYVFLDACFSGRTGEVGDKTLFKDTSFAQVIQPLLPDLKDPRISVISAAGENDMGLWLLQAKQGLFTTYLARGLSGEADDGDKTLHLEELFDYVSRKVEGAAARLKRSQSPTLNREQNTVLVQYGF